MQSKQEQSRLAGTWFLTAFLCIVLASAAFLVYFLLPNAAEPAQPVVSEPLTIIDLSEETEAELSAAFQDYFTEVSLNRLTDDYDNGLALYRQPLSSTAVEWFYYQITGSKDVTQAILTEAEKNDIPLQPEESGSSFRCANVIPFPGRRTPVRYSAELTEILPEDPGMESSTPDPGMEEADFFGGGTAEEKIPAGDVLSAGDAIGDFVIKSIMQAIANGKNDNPNNSPNALRI